MRNFAHPLVLAIFFRFFLFFQSPTAKTRALILMQNTPKVLVPFGGRETSI